VKVRFLADADLNKPILNGVLRRESAVDFQSALTAGLQRKKDPEVLALAAGSGRILVSHDIGTMPVHFQNYRDDASVQSAAKPFPGFIVKKADKKPRIPRI
jgi:hypothetical protein